MVVIKKQEGIPVDFGEFQLQFFYSDENIKKLQNLSETTAEKLKDVQDEDSMTQLEKIKEVITLIFDDIFGKGSFDKVYQFANQSTITTFEYLFQVIQGINIELEERFNEKTLSKYLS